MMGSDAQDSVTHQKEELKPMQHSIRISKKPKNLTDPRVRLWKLQHIGAAKMLQCELIVEQRPIDS